MRVFLLAASFVIVLFPGLMHEIELITQAAFLQQFEGPIDCDAIQLRVFLAGQSIETLRVQMPPLSIRSSRIWRWRVRRSPNAEGASGVAADFNALGI